MAERAHEAALHREHRHDTWRLAAPLRFGSVSVQPLERVTLRGAGTHPPQAWCIVTIAPFALVVRDAEGLRAWPIDGTAMSMAELRLRWPEVDALLADAAPLP